MIIIQLIILIPLTIEEYEGKIELPTIANGGKCGNDVSFTLSSPGADIDSYLTIEDLNKIEIVY